MRAIACLLLTVVLYALLLPATPSGQGTSREWTVYLRRVGPLLIGASIDDVRRKLNEPKALLAQSFTQNRNLPNEPDDSPCSFLLSKRAPSQIGLMFQKGIFVRADVRQRGVFTASGAQVGDSEARIHELYGEKIRVTPHHYPPEGAHYMIYTPTDAADRDYQLQFETDGHTVTRFRVGLGDAVAQVEGCA